MAVDGYLNFDTKVDTSGFEKGSDRINQKAKQTGANVVQTSENTADQVANTASECDANIKISVDGDQAVSKVSETNQRIQAILDDSERSNQSKAASIAAIYKQMGMDASEAWKKAWSSIERGTAESEKVSDSVKKSSEKIKSNIKDVDDTVDKSIDKNNINISDALDKLKSQLKGVAAAVGIAFGVKEIISFGKKAIESAAEVNAANSQLAQTFGSLQSTAEEAMQRVADASGITATRLKGVGTSIYAFAKTSGMDSVQALDMMEEALQVAADSAAYYDRSLEDTSETLKSFLKGNYENDAALGISSTETTRNAMANKLYGKSFKELSEAQKQLALLQMVKDANDLSGATGQAAREADGWENVIGNLKETWKQLIAVIGQPLLKAAVSVVKELTSALSFLLEKAQIAVNTLSELFGWELGNTASVADNISQSVTSQNELTEAVEETAEANDKSVAGFDKINTLAEKTAESDSGGSSGISQSVPVTPVVNEGAIEKSLDRLNDKFKKLINPIKIAWDVNSPQLIANVKTALESVKKLIGSISGSFEEVWTNGSGERFIGNIIIRFGDIIGVIGDVSNALKTAWDDNGNGTILIQSYFDRWNSLYELIHTVTDSFRTVWSDGAGVTILENVFAIVTNINNTVSELRTNFTEAWKENDNGIRIFEAVLGVLNTILGTASKITADTAKWANNIDFSPILESIAGLLESIEPLTGNIGEGLEWLYNNVLLPLASTIIEDSVPAFLDELAAAIDVCNAVIKKLKPLGKWLINNFLNPISEWTGGVIVDITTNLADKLEKIADLINGQLSFKEFIGDMSALEIVIGSVAAAVGLLLGANAFAGLLAKLPVLLSSILAQTSALIANAAAWAAANLPIIAVTAAIAAIIAIGGLLIKHWDEIKEVALGIWDSIQETLWGFFDNVVEIFNNVSEFLSGIWESIKETFSNVGTWFKEKFTAAWDNIKSAWSGVKEWFSDLWNNIKKIFSNVGAWFKEKFSAAWDKIKDVFKGIGGWFSDRWEDIKEVFSAVGTWFGNIFQTAWDNIKLIFSNPKEFFDEVWENIKSCFSHVTNWFKTTFSEAWQAVKDVFSAGGKIFDGIVDSISGVFTEVVNGLIDGINWVIAQPFDGINWALGKMRNVEILDWEPFSWLPTIDIPEIPHLAQGTVVPANYGNFLAVLGDNKRETEVVSPLSTIKKAVAEAMAESGGNSPKEIVLYTYLYPNSSAFHREVIKVVNSDKARRGG